MAIDALAEKLRLLLTQGTVSASRLSARDRLRLQGLFDAGVLVEEKSGAGRRVVLTNAESLLAFITRTYPTGLEGLSSELLPRSRAVMEQRDSKKSRELGPLTVLLRGFGEAQLQAGDLVLPVAQWTNVAGVAALRIADEKNWGFCGTLAVVENLEVFWHIEKIDHSVDIALFAQGRLSQRIVAWLSSAAMAEAHIIHYGDYDPVGLDEYLRLKQARPLRTRLYVPENLEDLLSRFGKRQLLDDSQAVLRRLRKSEDPDVAWIVAMMDRWGVGLEQEVLLSENLGKWIE